MQYMKKANILRKCYFIDTYEGFNYEQARESVDTLWKGSHQDTSMELVDSRLADLGEYYLEKRNIITDGLPEQVEQIAVCNIDVDLYEAVYAALISVKDKVVAGGVIIAEDYGHTPNLSGAQYAIKKFGEENKDKYLQFYLSSGQYILIKK